jgi:hypothetical protein
LQEHKGKEELTTSLLGDSRHPPKPPEREGVVHNNAPTGKLLQKKLLRTDLESVAAPDSTCWVFIFILSQCDI